MVQQPAGASRPTRQAATAKTVGRQGITIFVVLLVIPGIIAGVIKTMLGPRPAAHEAGIPVPAELEHFEDQVRAYLAERIARARLEPQSAEALAELGNAYAAHQLWPEAAGCFEAVAERDPNQRLAPFHRAISLAESGDPEAALVLLQNVVERFPDFAAARHRLGAMLLDRGAVEPAVAEFQAVIALAPRLAAGYVGVGEARLQQNDPQAAVPLLERALELSPDDRMTHYLLGTAYLRDGRVEEGRRHLAQGVDARRRYLVDPWSRAQWLGSMTVAAQLARALQFQRAGRSEEGVTLLERARRWHPHDLEIANNLALLYLDLGRLEPARTTLLDVIQEDPRFFRAHVNLVAVYCGLQDFERALEAADRALALAPDLAHARFTRARVLEQLGRLEPALADYRRALALDPAHANARRYLATLLHRRGQFAEARLELQWLLEHHPGDLDAAVLYCDVCIHLGQRQEAARVLGAARRLSSDDPRLQALSDRLDRGS